MPTYEYECNACGHRFEKSQSMTEEPLKKCPKCAKGVRRIIGKGSGIIFKGSGFYATDYRKASYKEKEKQDKGPVCPAQKDGGCSSCPKNAKT